MAVKNYVNSDEVVVSVDVTTRRDGNPPGP